MGDRKRPVSSVFLQVDDKGKASTMVVTAPRLSYADNDRQAQLLWRRDGPRTRRGDDRWSCRRFPEPAASASRTTGPSQLDHIVANAHVLVQQQERRAEGEQAGVHGGHRELCDDRRLARC